MLALPARLSAGLVKSAIADATMASMLNPVSDGASGGRFSNSFRKQVPHENFCNYSYRFGFRICCDFGVAADLRLPRRPIRFVLIGQ